MSNVAFVDYREVIRLKLVERSLRQKDLAERVDRSRAWVSQMLAGKRPLKPALVRPIGEALEMTGREIMRLRALVDCELGSEAELDARRGYLRGFVPATEPVVVSDSTRTGAVACWKASAVLQLAQCEGYQPDAEWIAATVRPMMTVEEVREALAHLRRHGKLGADDRLPSPCVDAPEASGPCDPGAVLAYHQQTLDLARDAVARVPENDRIFVAGSVALSEEDYEQFCQLLRALVAQTVRSAARAEPNRVYHLNVAAFPISLYTDSFADPRDIDDDGTAG